MMNLFEIIPFQVFPEMSVCSKGHVACQCSVWEGGGGQEGRK